MGLFYNLIDSPPISFSRERILPPSMAQNKKIFLVAAIALGFLIACYLAYSYLKRPYHGQAKTPFQGEYKNEMLNGQGKTNLSRCDREEGEYKNDDLSLGKKIFAHGGKGEFNDSEFIKGQAQNYRDETGIIITGKFIEGSMNGQGEVTLANGDILSGEFKDGKLNGQGKRTFSNGEILEGEFKDNKLNGRGLHMLPNGDYSDGEWNNGEWIRGVRVFGCLP